MDEVEHRDQEWMRHIQIIEDAVFCEEEAAGEICFWLDCLRREMGFVSDGAHYPKKETWAKEGE